MSWKENNLQKYYSSTPNNSSNAYKSSSLSMNNSNNTKSNYYRGGDRSYNNVDSNNNGQLSPIKNSVLTNRNNNGHNYNHSHSKSESSSPNNNNNNNNGLNMNRYSPKMRNSQSYTWSSTHQISTSPFKQYNRLNNSPDKRRSIAVVSAGNNSSPINTSTITTTATTNDELLNNSNAGVPNPFGGSKYRDPPPADILPLPPMQWMSCNTNSSDDSPPTPKCNDSIIQKLNISYSRLTAAVKA